jgi:hypothetical protein
MSPNFINIIIIIIIIIINQSSGYDIYRHHVVLCNMVASETLVTIYLITYHHIPVKEISTVNTWAYDLKIMMATTHYATAVFLNKQSMEKIYWMGAHIREYTGASPSQLCGMRYEKTEHMMMQDLPCK